MNPWKFECPEFVVRLNWTLAGGEKLDNESSIVMLCIKVCFFLMFNAFDCFVIWSNRFCAESSTF
jgi:hypothetical protein